MSPFMALIVLAVLIGAVVFLIGLFTRKRRIILLGAPAVLLLLVWLFLASARPNPQKEFDRLFGAENRRAASAIKTLKPTFMDGYFISFRMRPSDFETRIRPKLTESDMLPPTRFLRRQALPKGWPASIQSPASALHCDAGGFDVYLIYSPSEEAAYVSVLYAQW
jgi:hypothetical protein